MVEFKLVPLEEVESEPVEFNLVPLEETNKSEDKEFNLVPFKEPEIEASEKPGFFSSLKNPRELTSYNSLPVAFAQYLNEKGFTTFAGTPFKFATGGGKDPNIPEEYQDYYYQTQSKSKNAQESLDWLQSNPSIKEGKLYDYHKDMYDRYGYALEPEEGFDFAKVVETAKSNFPAFGAELVNAVVADPYLMSPWMWGGWAANAGKATALGTKAMAYAPKITQGSLMGVGSLPTLTAYSTIQQLSETGELDIDRIEGEVKLGGIFAFGLGTIGAGTSTRSSRILGLNHNDLVIRNKRAIDKLAETGDPYAQRVIKDSAEGVKPFEESLKSILDDIEATDLGINNVRNVDIDAATTRYNKSEFKKQVSTVNDFVGIEKEIAILKNNPKYKSISEKQLFEKAKYEYSQKSLYADKVKQAMFDEIIPDVKTAYNGMLLNGLQKHLNIKSIINNKAGIRALETAGTVGMLTGAGYYIKNPRENAFFDGFAVGLAGVGLWKAGSSIYARHKMLNQGKKLTKYTPSELEIRLKEIHKDLPEGVKLEDIGLVKTPEFYLDPKVNRADIRRLGRAEEIQLAKGEILSGMLLENYRNFVQVAAIDSNRMKEIIVAKVPNIKRRQAITKYIQEETKVTKLTKEEIAVSKDVVKVLDEMFNVTKGTELTFRRLENYLPNYWRFKSFQSDKDLNQTIRALILETSKRDNSMSGKTISEFKKFFPSYEAGIKAGLEPITTDVADIMTRYINSTTRALAQRRLVQMINTYEIPGRSNGIGGNSKLMYKELPKDLPYQQDYARMYHPSFLKDNIDVSKYTQKELLNMSPYVLKEAQPMLRMLFDARTDGIAMKAISNINFLQKRFSVGYSFFHAETLINNMMYAGFNPITSVQTGLSATGLGSLLKHLPGGKMLVPEWESTSARGMLKAGGHYDMLKAATKAGVEFSFPDDIGASRFYNTIGNVQQYLDNKIPFVGYLAKQGIEYAVVKPFQYIDRVTWDRVFNVGKLYAFQTNALRLMENPKYQSVGLKEIHKQAAIATNDMYGGLNWMQLYKDTVDPMLKDFKANAYSPKGRRYQQLLLFAPDWTTANARVIGRSFPGLNGDKMSRSLYQAYALRASVILAVGGSALNYAFTGKMLWENDDPTRIDLGNGQSLTLSKQFFEPFHWAVSPVGTLISKQGSFIKMAESMFFNKQYLNSPWPSPISKADRISLERVRDYAGFATMSMVPFGLRKIVEAIADGDKITVQDAAGFLLSNVGHPMYNNPNKPKYPGYIKVRDKIFN